MIQFKPGGNRFPVGRLELGETARNVKSWPSGTVTLGERIIQIQKYKYGNKNAEICVPADLEGDISCELSLQ